MSPAEIYFAVLLAAVLICLLAMRFAGHPTRSCPKCTSRVRLTAKRCRNCGYRFV